MPVSDLEHRIGKLGKALSEYAPELCLALRYVQPDAASSLTKSRVVLEKLLVQVYTHEMAREPRKPLLGDMLLDNQFTRKIERRILSRMNAIRDLANLGPHGEAVEPADAVSVLDNLCEVLEWYLSRYAGGHLGEVGEATLTPDARRDPEPPVEYLYVDRDRLQSYVEQLVPGMPAHAPLTIHDRVVRLLAHLEEAGLTLPRRPYRYREEALERRFRVETMTAYRAYIPPRRSPAAGPEGGGLRLWVSLRPDEQPESFEHVVGSLFLIEDCASRADDVTTFSAYSSLVLLLSSLREDHPSAEMHDQLAPFQQEEEARRRFAENPLGALVAMGARFGAERRIRALYRVRACCMDADPLGGPLSAVTTIAYPIAIQEAL